MASVGVGAEDSSAVAISLLAGWSGPEPWIEFGQGLLSAQEAAVRVGGRAMGYFRRNSSLLNLFRLFHYLVLNSKSLAAILSLVIETSQSFVPIFVPNLSIKREI